MPTQRVLKPSSTLLIVAFLFLIFFTSLFKVGGYDIWWHIKTGETIFKDLTVSKVDTFSYTHSGQKRTHIDIISDIIFYAVDKIGGPALISIFTALLIVFLFLLLIYHAVIVKKLELTTFILCALASFSIMQFKVIPRPETISLILLSGFLLLIDKFRSEKKIQYLYVLPLLSFLWVNTHQSAVLGIIIYIFFLISQIYRPFFKNDYRDDIYKRNLKHLLLISFLIIVCTCFNTSGIWILISPFLVKAGSFASITEWASLPDVKAHFIFSIAVICFFSGIFILSLFTKVDEFELLLFSLAIYLCISHVRFLPVFAVIAIPVTTKALSVVSRKYFKNPNRALNFIVLILCVGLFLKITIFKPVMEKSGIGLSNDTNLPIDAVDFLKDNKVKANIFNTLEWGGFIIYKLAPDIKVFIDGRTNTLYKEPFFNYYLESLNNYKVWQNAKEKFPFDLIVYPYSNSLSLIFPGFRDKNFKLIFFNEKSVIFARKTKKNEQLIASKGYKIIDLSNPLHQLKNLLNKPKELSLFEQDLLKSLKTNENNLISNYLLARLYAIKSPKQALPYVKKVRLIAKLRGINSPL